MAWATVKTARSGINSRRQPKILPIFARFAADLPSRMVLDLVWKEIEADPALKAQFQEEYGEKTKEIGAQDSVLPTAKIGNISALLFKILAMVAQQSLCVNLLLKM